MRPWERRLRDLAQLLRSCGETYFAPDLFRQNTNQFLQTSRTVTFIIQKNKSAIRDFEVWYKRYVLGPWASDPVMTWAKEARNVVEKEGDLDIHSSLRASVVFSHIASQDLVLSTTKKELLKANLEKLLRFALTKLPPAVADAAVLKMERRWVANSLPTHELIHAMTYTYSRMYEVCRDLAIHLDGDLDESVPHPTLLDPTSNDVAHTRYIKFAKPGVGRLTNVREEADPAFRPPPELMKLRDEFKSTGKPTNLSQTVANMAKLARYTFEQYGNHVPMLFFFDENWEQIDFLSAEFDHQSDKFVFWRYAADRAAYLRAYGLVWISELWIRDMKEQAKLPIRELPIIGERLHVIGVDVNDQRQIVTWDIRRAGTAGLPTLHEVNESEESGRETTIFFVQPVLAAMKVARGKSAG